ncbi:MAG: 2OG-Fe(II) oxygenase, partial [Gammaproteobacteria bacterium]|nr:2OG-Fe(II) oxygenase [Gammaproteobacteria bacterium]
QIAVHRDTVESGMHYRLNIILKHAKEGGAFVCDRKIIDWPRVKIFRPDICEHAVLPVIRGSRYVLSVGWILNKNRPTSVQ